MSDSEIRPGAGGTLIMPERIAQAELDLLACEQAACPVAHRFAPGLYIREVQLKAGTVAIGHYQMTRHLNIMLRGRVIMLNSDGSLTEMTAPQSYVGEPGRKIGYVLEDVVWHNVYATDETDIDKLEAMFLCKSTGWLQNAEARRELARFAHEADRADFQQMLDEYGFSELTATEQSEDESDQIPMPPGALPYRIAGSPIAGKGFFVTVPVAEGQRIAIARQAGMRTPAGRYVNHAARPNAVMAFDEHGDIVLLCTRAIGGCMGGDEGEEVTVDYRQSLALLGIHPLKETAPCQE